MIVKLPITLIKKIWAFPILMVVPPSHIPWRTATILLAKRINKWFNKENSTCSTCLRPGSPPLQNCQRQSTQSFISIFPRNPLLVFNLLFETPKNNAWYICFNLNLPARPTLRLSQQRIHPRFHRHGTSWFPRPGNPYAHFPHIWSVIFRMILMA